MRWTLGRAVVVLALTGGVGAGCAGPGVQGTLELPTDPEQAGWTFVRTHSAQGFARVENGALICSGARWQSPAFPVTPGQWYRLTFRSKATGPGMWAVQFLDDEGGPIMADHYCGFDASGDWGKNEFFFCGRPEVSRGQLWFHPLGDVPQTVAIDQVQVTTTPREEVWRWLDARYAESPALDWRSPVQRGRFLPRTFAALREGKALRVVMLGDSIVCDTANSAWELLVERMYPGARIDLIRSVRGGTGAPWYVQDNRVQEYVVRHEPDLLIIGGISNNFDVQAVRSVIRQVRQKISPEILVLSDPVGAHGDPRDWPKFLLEPGQKGDELRAMFAARGRYRMGLRDMAQEEQVEYLDVGTAWNLYLAHCGQPHEFFLRDPVHANARGRAILARFLELYFAPRMAVVPAVARDR